jgi:hypothetical protein
MDKDQESSRTPLGAALGAHASGYADLIHALLHAWQRSLWQKLLAILLLFGGITLCAMVLTAALLAATWDGPHRWNVVLAVAAVYLLLGAAGCWLLLRAASGPSPGNILADELRKDVLLAGRLLQDIRS